MSALSAVRPVGGSGGRESAAAFGGHISPLWWSSNGGAAPCSGKCQPGPADHNRVGKARSEHNEIVRLLSFSSLFKPNSFNLHASITICEV